MAHNYVSYVYILGRHGYMLQVFYVVTLIIFFFLYSKDALTELYCFKAAIIHMWFLVWISEWGKYAQPVLFGCPSGETASCSGAVFPS